MKNMLMVEGQSPSSYFK